MTKKDLQNGARFLQDRFDIALITDERNGNKDGKQFLPNNPDYIYYKGACDMLAALGLCFERTSNNHIIYK